MITKHAKANDYQRSQSISQALLSGDNAKQFSHGMICSLDSFLRFALTNQQDAFPLSVALNASASCKHKLPATTYEQGKLVGFRRKTKGEIAAITQLPLVFH